MGHVRVADHTLMYKIRQHFIFYYNYWFQIEIFVGSLFHICIFRHFPITIKTLNNKKIIYYSSVIVTNKTSGDRLLWSNNNIMKLNRVCGTCAVGVMHNSVQYCVLAVIRVTRSASTGTNHVCVICQTPDGRKKKELNFV